ncbi:MAG: DUF1820 family protein [Candidatus Competibacteraceae bacterium]|nr:DUF1820 family protein [Candidatus Competibacteraceae bacterium]
MTTRTSTRTRPIYKVIFINQGKVYEIFARQVRQGELYGFIQVEELLFGERTSLVVDPSEERLRGEFAGVARSHIPIHGVIRIDEVDKEGPVKVRALEDGDNITRFPGPGFSPGGKDG